MRVMVHLYQVLQMREFESQPSGDGCNSVIMVSLECHAEIISGLHQHKNIEEHWAFYGALRQLSLLMEGCKDEVLQG